MTPCRRSFSILNSNLENDIEYGDYLFGEDNYQTDDLESDLASTTNVTPVETNVTTNVTDELKVKISEGEISEEEENEFGNLKSRLSQTLAAIKSWKKSFPEDL